MPGFEYSYVPSFFICTDHRAGILPLVVEVRRYRGTLLADRACVLYSTDLVEDEVHVSCVCNKCDGNRLQQSLYVR